MSALRNLITEAGLDPWTTYEEWEQLLRLGEAIEAAITLPIVRAAFVAEAAADLEAANPSSIEGVKFGYYLEAAEDARSTPQGPRELWGSAMQEAAPE